ncbi:hypothetical protein C8F01DRAFT_694822 [Mycena amicta]|nr:hypothetical protein C8F01DRAFT_694822 [Mycena amicta]
MISDRETTKASSDSASSTRNTQLPGQVKARDGNTSIFHAGLYVSGHLLQACHLIPQSKGDEYVKRLEQFHGVPPEERMNTVESARNMVSMKAAWHTYVAKSVAAILVVPNRFLSKDDIAFTSQPRFAQDGNSYSEPSPENPSPTTSSLSSGKDSKEYKPELLLSETDIPLRPQSERIQQDAEKSVTADRQKKAAEEAAVKAAEEAIAHLVSARGYPEFLTPTEPPFNDQSQLVMQYLDTEGEFRVGLDDQWAVPHNTAARLREGTRLSVLALHTAYICAVWNAFSPDTENSVLAPDIPRFGHLTSFKLRAAPAFDSHTATLSSTSRQEQRREGWAWDLMLGWRIPSVVARQEAEMRRARDVEREANEAKVRQWSRTVEQ